jgi:D-glycero-D-manno-heptose 1,7-bisphosphate phosphatase
MNMEEERRKTERRAVFLDRDGVINRAIIQDGKPYPPSSVERLEILPGVVETCTRLQKAGFLLIVVTNQPDVGRGVQRREVVGEIHETLRAQVPVDDIRVCYHHDTDDCPCRKPRPGLILEAAREWNIDLSASFMVGDRWKDIEAGRRAGCRTVFIDYNYNEPRPESADYQADSLAAAVDWILKHSLKEVTR